MKNNKEKFVDVIIIGAWKSFFCQMLGNLGKLSEKNSLDKIKNSNQLLKNKSKMSNGEKNKQFDSSFDAQQILNEYSCY